MYVHGLVLYEQRDMKSVEYLQGPLSHLPPGGTRGAWISLRLVDDSDYRRRLYIGAMQSLDATGGPNDRSGLISSRTL